ncbi:Os08g0208400, partial [Oryza sativa Japonica Group]
PAPASRISTAGPAGCRSWPLGFTGSTARKPPRALAWDHCRRRVRSTRDCPIPFN